MSRPTTLLKDNTLYWVIRIYNDSQVLVDADSTPTVAVRKNGASVGDVVTVTKRSATTGIYDCSYNPASEVEGDQFTLEESATVSSQTYENSWSVVVEAAERGTDNAILASSAPTNWSLMAINGSGEITTSNPASGGGSAHTAEDVRDLILAGDKTPITMAVNKVSNVVLVDTTTTNTDMRGTNGANTVAPDNASIAAILADTDELQSNQGDWATATGFSTFNPATDTVANVTTVGSVTGAVTTDTASREASKATGFSTFDPATDTVANVTNVAVCASNTDMVGTDNALLASAAPANFNIMVIDGSGRVTTSNPASGGGSAHTAEDVRDLILGGDKTPIAVTTGSVNNVILVDTTTDLTNGGSGGGDDAATIYAYFTDTGRPVPFQADVSVIDANIDNLVTTIEDDGLGGYQFTALALENAPTAAGGSGLYQVTVTVQDDSSNVLQGARVNVDGTTLTLTTDSSGQVVFNLDSGVYTLEVSPPAGYNTPVGQVITVATSDISSTFTLTSNGGCSVPWLG